MTSASIVLVVDGSLLSVRFLLVTERPPSERTRKGMQAKADRGYHVGRPRQMTPEIIAQAHKRLQRKGASVRKVADSLGVSPALIYKYFSIRRTGSTVVIEPRAVPAAA